ncbi:hypothetical protein ACFX11_032284 [Malus domestica]
MSYVFKWQPQALNSKEREICVCVSVWVLQIHGGGENLRNDRHSFSCRFPQTAPNVDAQNRRSWNNVNPTVNLQEM